MRGQNITKQSRALEFGQVKQLVKEAEEKLPDRYKALGIELKPIDIAILAKDYSLVCNILDSGVETIWEGMENFFTLSTEIPVQGHPGTVMNLALEMQDVNIAQELYNHGATVTRFPMQEGPSLLHLAVEREDADFVRFILNHLEQDENTDTPVGIDDGYFGSREYCRKIHCVEEFETDTQYCGETPIQIAASMSNTKIVSMLLDAGANPDSSTETWTALCWAAFYENEEMIRLLLQHGAMPDQNCSTPMDLEDRVHHVLEKNASTSTVRREQERKRFKKKISYYKDRDKRQSLRARNSIKVDSALFIALQRPHEYVQTKTRSSVDIRSLEMILAARDECIPNRVNSDYEPRYRHVISYLKELLQRKDSATDEEIESAEIELCNAISTKIGTAGNGEITALYLSVSLGNADIVRLLCKYGADPMAEGLIHNEDENDPETYDTSLRWTPLIRAANIGNSAMIKALITAYKQMYLDSQVELAFYELYKERFPLNSLKHLISKQEAERVIEAGLPGFLNHQEPETTKSALHFAVQEIRYDATKTLCEEGADTSLISGCWDDGKLVLDTPLSLAIKTLKNNDPAHTRDAQRLREIIQLLVDYKSDMDIDLGECTPTPRAMLKEIGYMGFGK